MPPRRLDRPGTLQNRIADIRRDRGLSQLSVAERLNLHYTSVSRHENTGMVPCSAILSYALLYKVPPICLFFLPEEVHIAA